MFDGDEVDPDVSILDKTVTLSLCRRRTIVSESGKQKQQLASGSKVCSHSLSII